MGPGALFTRARDVQTGLPGVPYHAESTLSSAQVLKARANGAVHASHNREREMRLFAICEVTAQVCPSNLCLSNLCQAGHFFDPMSLARIASSQLGVPEEAQCLVEQTGGCFAELRRRERTQRARARRHSDRRINCTSIVHRGSISLEVEVSRHHADWQIWGLLDCTRHSQAGPWQRRVGMKERKQTAQGRDGRTARRHHTGILGEKTEVWC